MKKYTKKRFEEWMNSVTQSKAGTHLRRNDPIAFDVEYNCRKRLVEKHGARY